MAQIVWSLSNRSFKFHKIGNPTISHWVSLLLNATKLLTISLEDTINATLRWNKL